MEHPRSSLTPERRYRSAMLRRFGLLFHLSGLGLLLRRLRIEDHSVDRIRKAAASGSIVYVMHTRSVMDWLALTRVLERRRLPLARFTLGLRSTGFMPLWELVREVWQTARARLRGGKAPEPVTSGWLSAAVAEGLTTCLFLVRPPRTPFSRVHDDVVNPISALLDAQQRADHPILVVPIVVVWRRGPESVRGEAARVLLGSQEEPGPLQKLFAVAARTSTAVVQAGEPVDLGRLLQQFADQPRQRQARIARILLRRYLYRESHVIRGPRIRPHGWTRRLVLRSAEVRALVRDEARARDIPEATARAEVRKLFDHIAARMSYPVTRAAAWGCHLIFNRIFSGVDIRPEDLERLRVAVREGTPILVPSHRSHLDYLLLSWLLYTHDIVIPHVVAGENLSFWPVGAIFRRVGAIFIRRSFKGERLYPVVFARYLRQLIRDGFPIEFFIEGGRSRTGKLLSPRLGVLQMVMDAATDGREDRATTMLPIAISYEQIAEEGAYRRELSGASKEKEDLGQVVRASRVLRKRFGKVYLRVGEPLSIREALAEQDAPWVDLDRTHQREALQYVGERLMFRIARQMVLLPTGLVAMALLAQPGRGVRLDVLQRRVHRLDTLLQSQGAVPGAQLSGWSIQEALRRFEREKLIHRLTDEEGDILQLADDRRITLEYYKNSLLHFVAPISLMAGAVRALRDQLDVDALFRLFRTQVFLLRYEFTLDPEVPLHRLQRQALRGLCEYGALSCADDDTVQIGDPARVIELAELTRNLLESYLLVLRGAHALRSRELSAKDLPKRIQAVGEGLLAVEELRRPESLSIVNLRNGIKAFQEEQAIRLDDTGLHVDEATWQQYRAVFKRLLG